MEGIHAALKVSRAVVAAVSCLYFLRAQFKQIKTRNRDVTPFICLQFAMLLVLGGEAAITNIRAGVMPDILPIAATFLYIFALLLQLNHLWPSTVEEKQPAWHVHLGSWTILVVVGMLAIVELVIIPPFSNST